MQELTASIESSALSSGSFEEFEDRVFAAICESGRALAAEALASKDDELARAVPHGWRVKDRRSKTVMTRFGPVEVSRRRYIDDSGRTRHLLDEHLALPARARISPSLERAMVALSAEVSFREAAAVLAAVLDVHVSHAAVHSLSRRAGERLAAESAAVASGLLEQGLDPGGTEDASMLFCEADGTVVALQGAHRRRGEVRLAVFYTDKEEGPGAVHAGLQDADAFWARAVAAGGSHYDLSTVRSCVVAGDGAGWVRGGLDVLPYSRFQIDPFHVRKALSRACADHSFASRVFSAVYEEGHAAADGMLAAFAREHPGVADDVEGVRRYLSANADGLWRSGPGCGTIEGHIDKVLANRMKKRGRRWSPAGADAMAHVLAARRCGRPMPCGSWHGPETDHGGTVPYDAARRPGSRRRSGCRVPQARIVSHRTGESFTRTLRDIAGTRRAEY